MHAGPREQQDGQQEAWEQEPWDRSGTELQQYARRREPNCTSRTRGRGRWRCWRRRGRRHRISPNCLLWQLPSLVASPCALWTCEEVAGGARGLLTLPPRRPCTAHAAASAFNLSSSPAASCLRAKAREVGLHCMGTARATGHTEPYGTVSVRATCRFEWTCSSINSACPHRWRLNFKVTCRLFLWRFSWTLVHNMHWREVMLGWQMERVMAESSGALRVLQGPGPKARAWHLIPFTASCVFPFSLKTL